MPPPQKVLSLRTFCLRSITKNLCVYWLNGSSLLRKFVEEPSKFRASDADIEHILKNLYQNSYLSKSIFLLLMHNYLRAIDLSFIKKRSILSDEMCVFIGNNCFVSFKSLARRLTLSQFFCKFWSLLQNLVELNLFGQNIIESRVLSQLIKPQKLKRLNLAFTRTKKQVSDTILDTCKKLEYLNLDNCQFIPDQSIEQLCMEPAISQSIRFLHLCVSQDTIEVCLLKCTDLRSLEVNGLLKKLTSLYKTHLNAEDQECSNRHERSWTKSCLFSPALVSKLFKLRRTFCSSRRTWKL